MKNDKSIAHNRSNTIQPSRRILIVSADLQQIYGRRNKCTRHIHSSLTACQQLFVHYSHGGYPPTNRATDPPITNPKNGANPQTPHPGSPSGPCVSFSGCLGVAGYSMHSPGCRRQRSASSPYSAWGRSSCAMGACSSGQSDEVELVHEMLSKDILSSGEVGDG